MNKILFWMLALFGEAIIITSFLLFGADTPGDIKALNIIVSSIILGCFMYPMSKSPIKLDDPSAHDAAGLGISWTALSLYSVAAFIFMITCYFYEPRPSFTLQLIVQLVLLFLLMLALLGGAAARTKTAQVHASQTQLKAGIEMMRAAARDAVDEATLQPGIPTNVKQQLESIAERLRYTSPSLKPEAQSTELQFIEVIGNVRRALSNYEMNAATIDSGIARATLLATRRSQLLN